MTDRLGGESPPSKRVDGTCGMCGSELHPEADYCAECWRQWQAGEWAARPGKTRVDDDAGQTPWCEKHDCEYGPGFCDLGLSPSCGLCDAEIREYNRKILTGENVTEAVEAERARIERIIDTLPALRVNGTVQSAPEYRLALREAIACVGEQSDS